MTGRSLADVALASPAPAPARSRVRAVLLAVLLAEYVLAVAWAYSGLYMDDAYIGFRYVANLLSGHGLAFNHGAPIEGVSNIAWLLLLVPLSAAVGPLLAAKLLGPVCIAATLLLLYAAGARLFRTLAGTWGAFAFAPALLLLLTVANPDYMVFSMLGMETPFLSAVLAAMLFVAARGANPALLATLGALAFLIHPEAVLVLPLALALALWSGAMTRRDGARAALIFLGWIALATAARWLYFGDLLPNTFNAKPTNVVRLFLNLSAFITGASTNIAFPFAGALAFALMALGYAAVRRTAPLAAAVAAATVLVGLAFGIYATADWTKLGRYFAPYAPVALVLLCAGVLEIERLLRARAHPSGTTYAAALLIGLTIGVPGIAHTFFPLLDASRLAYPGYVMTGEALVEPALWMRDNLPREATIATRRIGALAYYSEHRVFDYKFGLTERDIAQLVRRNGRPFDDPNDAALAAAWRTRSPDYLLEDGDVIDRIAAAAGGTRASFRVHDLEYRVIRTFPIGKEAEWTLAQRLLPAAGGR